MEQRDENVRQIDQPNHNGSDEGAGAAEEGSGAAAATAAAYERARAELQGAVTRLRAEVARVDLTQTRLQARNWVRENPELASMLAIGGGLLVGKLLSSAFKPEPPPTLSARLRSRADGLTAHAQQLAEDVAAAVAGGAVLASDAVSRKARVASEHAQEAGEMLMRRAGEAASVASHGAAEMGEVLAERARAYGDSASHMAHSAASSLHKSAGKLEHKLGKRVGRGADYAESVLDATRTIVAAAVIRRVNGWLRKMS